MTIREQILETFKSDLATLGIFQRILVMKFVDIKTLQAPAATIYSFETRRVSDFEKAAGYETWVWTIAVEILDQTEQLEKRQGQVHEKVLSNPQRTGLAMGTSFERETFDGTDSTLVRGLKTLYFDVIFRHPWGSPGT